MRKTAFPYMAVSLVAAAAPLGAASSDLEVGSRRTLSANGAISQVIVDVPDIIATFLPNTRQVEVRGLKPGNANVTLVADGGRANYPIHVVEAGANDASEVRRQLATYPGMDDVRIERRGSRYVLSGPVDDLVAHDDAVTLSSTLAGQEVADRTQVAGPQMVAVDVRFVAISDTTLKSLGFNFSKLSGGFQTALTAPNTLTSYSANRGGLQVSSSVPLQNAFNLFLASRGSGILGVLSALSDTGLSQVLAQPTLLARSGEQADFIAGGDVPIPVPQGGSTSGAITIEYRPYGVRLSVEPYVLSSRRIVLKLAPEVSELDYSNRVALQGFNVPGFRRRSANTTVELGDGESFVIAGLTYSSSSQNDSKVPMFGDIPILGSLFRRTERSREKLELIIVATPRLVNPLSAADTAKTMSPSLPAPDLADSVLHPRALEKRAASFGLSR
jgi:pilus assembly protein CpaC